MGSCQHYFLFIPASTAKGTTEIQEPLLCFLAESSGQRAWGNQGDGLDLALETPGLSGSEEQSEGLSQSKFPGALAWGSWYLKYFGGVLRKQPGGVGTSFGRLGNHAFTLLREQGMGVGVGVSWRKGSQGEKRFCERLKGKVSGL